MRIAELVRIVGELKGRTAPGFGQLSLDGDPVERLHDRDGQPRRQAVNVSVEGAPS